MVGAAIQDSGELIMAINPPTDIVLDVVNAADPARLEVAQARLKAGQAAAEAQRLASSDQGFDTNLVKNHVRDSASLHSDQKKEVPQAYRKFESMVLSSFLKSMMPDSEEIYGKGATGEIWKGMMAEQLAGEISKKGGIGIADKLMENGSTAIRTKADADENRGGRLSMATQLIDQNQMQVLDRLVTGIDRPKEKS
jgi:Rod binding domain-containing protein